MTLNQFSNLAEIVGVIIIVITLIYLSVQVRQNTQALYSTGAQRTHDALSTGFKMLATNSGCNRIFRSGCRDPSMLTDDEVVPAMLAGRSKGDRPKRRSCPLR